METGRGKPSHPRHTSRGFPRVFLKPSETDFAFANRHLRTNFRGFRRFFARAYMRAAYGASGPEKTLYTPQTLGTFGRLKEQIGITFKNASEGLSETLENPRKPSDEGPSEFLQKRGVFFGLDVSKNQKTVANIRRRAHEDSGAD